jgi:predicted TIM-barrel fold metal-dependent hydrolase
MIIDFHSHLFPNEICEHRDVFFPSEPAFKLLYQSPKSRLVNAAQMLKAMDANQVDKAVVFGFPWKNPDTFKRHNDFIMEVVVKFPDRFIGLGCFDIAGSHAVTEAQRCLEGGLSGIGELAFYQSDIQESALDQLEPIMKMCAARDLPVLIHTNEPIGHPYPGKTQNTLAQIYQLIKRFSENKIVLAHWGGGLFFFSLLKKEVKDILKNVCFDTAASPYLYNPEIYSIAVDLIGADKILFGSDYPLLSPAKYFDEMKKAGLTREQMNKICGENAGKLLKLAS